MDGNRITYMFPSLIGRLKTALLFRRLDIYHPVSIPYRKTKNYKRITSCPASSSVSIPYRKTKNTSDILITLPSPEEFPSLIGRLKTEPCGSPDGFAAQFPSLIGRLKTETGRRRIIISLSFPYLIGRLKTRITDGCLVKPVLRFHPL